MWPQASMAMLRELDAESRYERMVGAPGLALALGLYGC